MASKSMKPSSPAKPKELTPEEKAQQIARFLSQKRESFVTSILFGLVHNPNHGLTPEQAVDWSIKTADLLMEKLYPIVKDGPKTEK